MGRLFQVNDQVLLDITQRNGRGLPPIVITSVCVDSEPHRVVLRPRFKKVDVQIGRGGVRNLLDYYAALRPPPPPPGTIGPRPDPPTFDNLEDFATGEQAMERAIARALEAVAAERCPNLVRAIRPLVRDIDGDHEGRITIHRLYCIVEIDLYVAVNLRGLMDPDDYDTLIDSVEAELRQTGKTYVSQQASVRRGGRQVPDFPIFRRKGLNALIAYLKVGIGTFTVQSGWDEDDARVPCKKKIRREKFGFDLEFQPRFETVPRRIDDPVEEASRLPEFEDPELEPAD